MINYDVMITDKATNDVGDIATYISGDLSDPMAANRILEKFERAIAGLSQMPTRHELVKDEDIALKRIRKIYVDNYILFYIVNDIDHTVVIIRVLFNKRDWIDLI